MTSHVAKIVEIVGSSEKSWHSKLPVAMRREYWGFCEYTNVVLINRNIATIINKKKDRSST